MLCFAKNISSVTDIACVCVCLRLLQLIAFVLLHLSGAESGSRLAAGDVCHSDILPTRPNGHSHPLPCLRISKGAVSKSNRMLLHRIPLVTQFRFMQAHSVGHFHSFRKRGQASLQNPAAFVGNSVYLHFVSQFISAEGDIKSEMQVTRHPEKSSSALVQLASFIFLSR